jgi:lactaldehyde dehydrogenase/glycolaldehyde dehydrogenase
MKEYKAFIGGEFTAGSGGLFSVYNPATGEEIGRAPNCGPEDADRAVEAAWQAQKSWRKIPAAERAEYLKKLASLVFAHQERLSKFLNAEEGKILSSALYEIGGAGALADYHAGWARRIEGELVQSDSADENISVYKEPVGVVACIIPWNFPVYILFRKMCPALIAGNAVLIKPSSETPLIALEMAELFTEAGFPKGLINIITGSGKVLGAAIAKNPKVSMISLTGSSEAGREIMRNGADNITKVSLELGGKAPAIVMDDADLDLAADCIVQAKINNAGQVCNTVERIYAHERIVKELTGKLMERLSKVSFSRDDPAGQFVMGPMINKNAVMHTHGFVERAVKAGAKILLGGNIPPGPGAFYPMTLLTECRQDMEIMHEEIFGPVLPLAVFSSLQEALTMANDCKYGLTSTLYTRDLKTAMIFSNEIEFGELYINRGQGEAFQGYHSGWKQTGIGGDDGKHGLEEFLQTRTVYIKY